MTVRQLCLDRVKKMSLTFVISVVLVLIPPRFALECLKCEERRDQNGTLISGNCVNDLTNAEIVNCLNKCSIFHTNDPTQNMEILIRDCAATENHCERQAEALQTSNSSIVKCHICDYDLCNIAINKTRYKTLIVTVFPMIIAYALSRS
ncbi:uncharacterized protein LOC134837518 [Culicoides brevitarsis]|uniref:uncharacterized protein LOC134837518 n=1 Tax=Culicoides brevitarsis TaxID=469753 RepID=UPI00307B1B5D